MSILEQDTQDLVWSGMRSAEQALTIADIPSPARWTIWKVPSIAHSHQFAFFIPDNALAFFGRNFDPLAFLIFSSRSGNSKLGFESDPARHGRVKNRESTQRHRQDFRIHGPLLSRPLKQRRLCVDTTQSLLIWRLFPQTLLSGIRFHNFSTVADNHKRRLRRLSFF
jgi:hypothetical protein